MAGRGVDALRGSDEVVRRRVVDAWHEFLRVAIDQREPGGLDLDHQAMALEKYVIVAAERDREHRRLIRDERLRMLVTGIVASAPDLHRDRQLVAVQRLRVLAGCG